MHCISETLTGTTMTEPRKNAVYAHRHPRGKSQTSARALKLNERRHKAYQLALAGKPLYAIAEQLGCAPSTAHEDISKRAEEVCPKVTAQQQLQKSLARLEQQYEVLHPSPKRRHCRHQGSARQC
jgi:uncharacterized protein (DUF3084 family)